MRWLDFNQRPLRSGLVLGLMLPTGVLLGAAAFGFFMLGMEKAGGGTGGAAGVIGLIVVPLTALLALPWSLFAIKVINGHALVPAAIGGLFANGLILGLAIGLITRFRKSAPRPAVPTHEQTEAWVPLPRAATTAPFNRKKVVGSFLMIAGGLGLLLALPGALLAVKFYAFVAATIALLIITAGWLLHGSRPQAEATPPGRLAQWELPLTFAALLIAGLWGFWLIKSGQWSNWQGQDEAERLKAPAWTQGLDEFSGGMGVDAVKQRLTRQGFNVRCYGNLQPNEGMQPGDTHACWTIANNAWGIPSRMVAFSFGADGLRQIRLDFPSEQWPAVKRWFDQLSGPSTGTFGRDQGGNLIHGKMLRTGQVLTAEPNHMPTAMVMWQARSMLQATVCRSKALKPEQWDLICRNKGGLDARKLGATLDEAFKDFQKCRFEGFYYAPWDNNYAHPYFTKNGLKPQTEDDTGLYIFQVKDTLFGLPVTEVMVPGTWDLHGVVFDIPLAEARKAMKIKFGSEFRASAQSDAAEVPELSAAKNPRQSVLFCNEAEGD